MIYTETCVVLPTGSPYAEALELEGYASYPLPDGELRAYCKFGTFPRGQLLRSLIEIHDRAAIAALRIDPNWRESFACCELTATGACIVLINPKSGIPTLHPSGDYSL